MITVSTAPPARVTWLCPHAVADYLAAAERDLLAIDRAVALDLDDELGVGEADGAVAGRRPEHVASIGGAASIVFAIRRLPLTQAVEADDAAGPGIGDQPHLAALPRLEPRRGPGRDVEPEAARLVAIELQRRVGLEEMVVRADLDRPVAGIGDDERDGRPPGIELDIALGDENFAGEHRMPRENPSPACGRGWLRAPAVETG